jgi:hypothetical protein
MKKGLETIMIQGVCNNTLNMNCPGINGLNNNLNLIDLIIINKDIIIFNLYIYDTNRTFKSVNYIQFIDLLKNKLNVYLKENIKIEEGNNSFIIYNLNKPIFSLKVLINENCLKSLIL